MRKIQMMGIDHSRATVAERELFSLTKAKQKELMEAVIRQQGVGGCVLLSTCNRTELYVSLQTEEDIDLYRIFCHIRRLTHAAHPVYGKFFLINLQYVFHKTIRRKKHHIISLPLPDTSGNISGDLPVFCTLSPGIPAAYVAADKNPAVFFWERRLHINPIGITVCCQKLPVIEHGKHCS